MEQSEFKTRFRALRMKSIWGLGSYTQIWANVGSTSLDKYLTELSMLYLASDESQKLSIYDFCGRRRSILNNLFVFVRRVGKLISSESDKKWFETGIAAAMIDGGRTDFRDVIVSLVLLRFMAEKHGIDTKPIFDHFIGPAQGDMKSILENARDHSESDILYTVRRFGPLT